jgi:hypothetical protein
MPYSDVYAGQGRAGQGAGQHVVSHDIYLVPQANPLLCCAVCSLLAPCHHDAR